MTTEDEAQRRLADDAEAEIEAALDRSKASGHAPEQRAAFWQTVRRWLQHPDLLGEDGYLRITVHNQIIFRTSIPEMKDEAFALMQELASQYQPAADPGMCESLVISIFECFAEPPEYPETLHFLHSLAADARTRWATFEAYRLFPWWLPVHSEKYSAGNVTPADCEAWFRQRFPWMVDKTRVVIDWSTVTDEAVLYDLLDRQCGFPTGRTRTLEALDDAWDDGETDANGPPYRFEFRHPDKVPPSANGLVGIFDEIAKTVWLIHGDPFRGGLHPEEAT
ncbi:MAG: hypothetical protein EOP87_11675 [Verrucomicrobiaceae bacterium]|nr:MAG: hypothetical protein EOP87_11675 [Verrucomicrobiaceae bacterium]